MQLASPLLNLLWKGQAWHWYSIKQSAFNSFKAALTSLPILCIPVLHDLFVICKDALDTHIGAVLEQCGQPVTFFLCKLSSTECSYSVTDHKLLAISLVCQCQCCYLHSSHSTVVFIDNKRQFVYLISHCYNQAKCAEWRNWQSFTWTFAILLALPILQLTDYYD